MSKNVEFHSYSVNVKTALKDKAIAFLHEIGGEIRSQAQRNSRRKTSQTAGSYQYKVDEDALAVHIGSDYWNAIYEEFGTGEHAILSLIHILDGELLMVLCMRIGKNRNSHLMM